MPDFFFGKKADHAWLPPDTKEKGEKLGNFIQTTANPPTTAAKIPGIIDEITKKSGGTIKKWGALGMCWGGKVLLSFPDVILDRIDRLIQHRSYP